FCPSSCMAAADANALVGTDYAFETADEPVRTATSRLVAGHARFYTTSAVMQTQRASVESDRGSLLVIVHRLMGSMNFSRSEVLPRCHHSSAPSWLPRAPHLNSQRRPTRTKSKE